MSRYGLFIAIVGTLAGSAAGSARIDLRPDGLTVIPGDPPSVVTAIGQNVNVDLWLVDTGGDPEGNLSAWSIFLDFSSTSPGLSIPDNQFHWENPFGVGAVFSDLPNTSWVYPLPAPNPFFQITIPDGGEVRLGDIDVVVDAHPSLLGVTGAFDYGPGFLQSHDGSLTGGQLLFVPEPGTLALLLVGGGALLRRRRE